ncbi:MAG: MarR family transcriptional regulator [Hamadaea sp.]|nr:MarR family transcriptional regulator [Hamadaea sp.]NUT22380.1 MarR family transcriptional regulator [Hamadaea sp.]
MAQKPTTKGPPERDEDGVRRFVEHTAMTFANYGMPRMAARVLMLLMAAEESTLTAAEIADGLAISPAAVSGSVRYLQQLGLVVKEPVPGSRRDVYRLPDDAWYQGAMVKGGIFAVVGKLAAEGVEAAGGRGTVAGGRIAEMADFYAFIQDEMAGLMERWEARRADER